MKMVVDLPEGSRSGARNGLSHFRLSRAGDLRLLLRAPGPRSHGRNLRPFWFLSPMRTSYRYLQHFMLHPYIWRYLKGGTAALLGREVASGIGQARRTVPGRRRLSPASAKARAARTCSPGPAWTRPGPRAHSLAEAVLELLKDGKPLSHGIWKRPTWPVVARVGLKRKAASPKRRATVSTMALSRACSGWRSPASPAASILDPGRTASRSRTSRSITAAGLPAAELEQHRGRLPRARHPMPRRADGALRLARHSV